METLSMLKVGYTLLRSETPATDLVNAFMDWAARRSLLLLAVFVPPYLAYRLASSALAAASPEDVAGKVVLVTGASSGIGEQVAYRYARRARGWRWWRGGRRAWGGGGEGEALGSPDVLAVPGDVARPDDCRRFVQATVEHFGRRKCHSLHAFLPEFCRDCIDGPACLPEF